MFPELTQCISFLANLQRGDYTYLVMPFGLNNAPTVFLTLLNDILCDMFNKYVFVYIDENFFSETLQHHIEH